MGCPAAIGGRPTAGLACCTHGPYAAGSPPFGWYESEVHCGAEGGNVVGVHAAWAACGLIRQAPPVVHGVPVSLLGPGIQDWPIAGLPLAAGIQPVTCCTQACGIFHGCANGFAMVLNSASTGSRIATQALVTVRLRRLRLGHVLLPVAVLRRVEEARPWVGEACSVRAGGQLVSTRRLGADEAAAPCVPRAGVT